MTQDTKSSLQRAELQEAPWTRSEDERGRSSCANLAALEHDLSDLGWDRSDPDGEFAWGQDQEGG